MFPGAYLLKLPVLSHFVRVNDSSSYFGAELKLLIPTSVTSPPSEQNQSLSILPRQHDCLEENNMVDRLVLTLRISKQWLTYGSQRSPILSCVASACNSTKLLYISDLGKEHSVLRVSLSKAYNSCLPFRTPSLPSATKTPNLIDMMGSFKQLAASLNSYRICSHMRGD